MFLVSAVAFSVHFSRKLAEANVNHRLPKLREASVVAHEARKCKRLRLQIRGSLIFVGFVQYLRRPRRAFSFFLRGQSFGGPAFCALKIEQKYIVIIEDLGVSKKRKEIV